MTAIASPNLGPEVDHRARRSSTPLSEFTPAPFLVVGIASSLGPTSLDDLELRARSLTRDQIRVWFSRFEGTEEATVLSTCHRVELVLLVRSESVVDRWLAVLPGMPETWQVREGWELVHHLFRVAAGRESLAVGEVEVRRQVRTAQRSVESRHPRPVLARLLSAAVEAAGRVSGSSRPPPSVAAVAAAKLLELVDRPLPRVLVVGAGAVGRQVAEYLSPSAQVTLVYHRAAPKDGFVRATGARPVPFDRLTEELGRSDAAVTAVKSGVPCLRASDLPRDRPLVLVDLGVPRNINPDVRELSNVRLIDLEELHSGPLPFPTEPVQDAQVEGHARQFFDEFGRRLAAPGVDAWLRSAEGIRQSELATARRFWGTLTPSQEVAIERLTQRLVTRLLVPPAHRLRSLPAGPEGDRERRLALELLRPDPDDL